MHLYYRHAPGVLCKVGREKDDLDWRGAPGYPPPGIDARGNGGYVICWYAAGLECLDQTPPELWPAWLTSYFWPPSAPQGPRTPPASGRSDAAVEGIIRTVREATEPGRNSCLYWAAHRLRERSSNGGPGRAEARRRLIDAAIDAGLTKIEAEKSFDSAWGAA